MYLKNRINVLVSAAIISIAAFSTGAQAPRPDFNRPQTFDVQHYAIRTSFDRVKKRVFGDTTVSLRPLAGGLHRIELDAVDLSFSSVKLDPSGSDLKYRTAGGQIIIDLDRSYGPDDLISVRLVYTAAPKRGIYFIDAESGKNGVAHSQQIWTHGQPDEARHWFPSFDFPSDKATTEQYLTVDSSDTVIGNGELVGRTKNADGTQTWHYRMDVPHSTYLVSFVVGKYSFRAAKHREVPLGYYVYPGTESIIDKAFTRTGGMMGIFEDLTGVAFPFNKYDQTIVAGFEIGGMENVTATTLDDSSVFFAAFDFGYGSTMDLVSHELAHSWFGDMVTCRNWAELWLNEGFATYMEAAYREKEFGRESYLTKIRSDAADFLINDSVNKRRHGLFNLRAHDLPSLFKNSTTTYNKGSVVLHMLREQIGTETFWKGIKQYLERHRFGSVETVDLQKVMEEVSEQDLGWFFDQWIYSTRSPTLDIRHSYEHKSRTVKVTISQTQKPETLVPSAFRLPIEVEIRTADGSTFHPVTITDRSDTFTLPSTAKPIEIIIDPKQKVPLKTVRIGPAAGQKG